MKYLAALKWNLGFIKGWGEQSNQIYLSIHINSIVYPSFTSFYEVLKRLVNASYLAHYLNKVTNNNVRFRLTLLTLMLKI